MTDEIDQLYEVAPEAFTALRAELVAAAKKRGDKDLAKRLGAARRPTTAAWVVNTLIRSDAAVRDELHDLGERLRAAHASMDGGQIRELSTAQRKLIDHLTRAALAAAGLAQPTAALRDDVVGTLQAAIADPEVAGRLGRMSKAERWSGFGDFGAVTEVGAQGGRKAKQSDAAKAPGSTEADPAKANPAVPAAPNPAEPEATDQAEPEAPNPAEPEADTGPTEDELAAARDVVTTAQTALDDAERRHAVTVDELSKHESHVVTARRRYEKLLEKLSAAEHELSSADAGRVAAEKSAGEAADLVLRAKAHLTDAESELLDLGGRG